MPYFRFDYAAAYAIDAATITLSIFSRRY